MVNVARPMSARKWLRAHVWGHAVVLSIPVGIVAGLGAILFSVVLDQSNALFLQRGAGYVMPRPGADGGTTVVQMPVRRGLLVIIPAVGGLLAGVLVYWLAPEAEGHGTDAVVDAFHRHRGVIRRRVPLVKTIASALTIGSGGSAGREGPIGQIGAGFGSALASWLKASDRERRLLMAAGAAAGIGAVFRAPLGGALFITEVLYSEMEFESAALAPAFVASIVAYSVYCSFTGVWGPIFRVPALQFNHPMELPFYALLGLACVVVGSVYVRVFYAVRDRIFRPLPIPNHVKPAIGGLAVGVIGFFLPQALGMGYGWVQLAIDGNLPLRIAAWLVGVKIVATALTISSGGSGGVFAPSIVIGGCLGAVAGAVLHRLFPGIVTQPSAFILVGMAGFFAGVAKAPIASLVMVSEMTTGYGLLVPLMLTTAIAYLLTPRRLSIYEKQVPSRVDSPAHEGEFARDVLESLHVRDALVPDGPLTTFRRDTPLREILAAVANTRQLVYPILRDGRELDGVIDVHDIRLFLTEQAMSPQLLVADDLRAADYRVLAMDEDLASALRKFHAVQLPALPVVASEESREVIGVLSRRDVIAAYHDKMYRIGTAPPAGPAAPL